MGVFTVRETLWFAARFYYGYGIDTKKMSDKVEALIDAVGLRSCADTIVGNLFFKGLSGGKLLFSSCFYMLTLCSCIKVKLGVLV